MEINERWWSFNTICSSFLFFIVIMILRVPHNDSLHLKPAYWKPQPGQICRAGTMKIFSCKRYFYSSLSFSQKSSEDPSENTLRAIWPFFKSLAWTLGYELRISQGGLLFQNISHINKELRGISGIYPWYFLESFLLDRLWSCHVLSATSLKVLIQPL